MSLLQELVKDGNALSIKLDRLQQAISALEAAFGWSAQADAADCSDADTPFKERPSIEQVQ